MGRAQVFHCPDRSFDSGFNLSHIPGTKNPIVFNWTIQASVLMLNLDKNQSSTIGIILKFCIKYFIILWVESRYTWISKNSKNFTWVFIYEISGNNQAVSQRNLYLLPYWINSTSNDYHCYEMTILFELFVSGWLCAGVSCDMFLFFSLLIWKSVLLELLYLSIRRRRTDLPDSSVVWYLTLWFDLVLAHLTRWEWWLRWRPHHLLWTQTFGKHGTKREVSNCKLLILIQFH